MSEYTVRVMRRTVPLLGDPTRVRKLEHDEVTLEASDEDMALYLAMKAECAEGGSRLRVYVEIDTATGGSQGRGDYALMKIREEERRKS